MPDWRRPLDVRVDLSATPTHPSEEVGVTGYMSQDAFERLRAGMGCCTCFSVLPCWPRAENMRRYAEVDWNLPHRGPGEMLQLICENRCVVCGSEVTPEFFHRMMEFGGDA